MNNKSFDKIFYPRSIALVGASNDINKIGGYVFSQIIKQGQIEPIPINAHSPDVQGIKAYKSVSSIHKKVDLVIIAIPGIFVIDVIKDCIKADVKNIVIISAGFKEAGEEGIEREKELRKIIEKNNLNVIGPNCLGILNPQIGLNCSFAKDIPRAGDIALISQSGAVIDAVIDWSFKHKVGFSKVVSLGNMAGLDELDSLNYLKDDKYTKAVVFYMETLENGHEFAKVLREISKKKPVIIIKPGNSDSAKSAIGSHTGSLAQDSILVETLFKENNAIVVETLNELYNVLIGLKAKFNKHNDMTIVTNAGGPGVIATDWCANSGYELYKFDNSQKRKFKLPAEASVNNPIDILGDGKSDRYLIALKQLEKIKDVNNILILLTPQIMTDSENIAKAIVEFSKKSKKNVFTSFLGDKEIKRALSYFDFHDFANFSTPSEALIAMSKLRDYKNFKYEEKTQKMRMDNAQYIKVSKKLKGRTGLLDYELSKEVLKVIDLEIFEKQIVKSEGDVLKLKLNANSKYVIKIDGPDFIHKKDIGGVKVGVSHLDVSDEVLKMHKIATSLSSNFSITIEEMVSGNEVICGLKHDETLGNFILFGMGGTYVSVFKDVNFSMCPLTVEGAFSLVERSKVNTILKGYRGSKAINYNKLYRVLIRLSYLYEIFPQIKEVDFNPIIVNDKGCYLVDVKLLL